MTTKTEDSARTPTRTWSIELLGKVCIIGETLDSENIVILRNVNASTETMMLKIDVIDYFEGKSQGLHRISDHYTHRVFFFQKNLPWIFTDFFRPL